MGTSEIFLSVICVLSLFVLAIRLYNNTFNNVTGRETGDPLQSASVEQKEKESFHSADHWGDPTWDPGYFFNRFNGIEYASPDRWPEEEMITKTMLDNLKMNSVSGDRDTYNYESLSVVPLRMYNTKPWARFSMDPSLYMPANLQNPE